MATLEAHAYVDAKVVAPVEQIEQRALLASLEAKAYADHAAEELGAALRATSRMVLELSRRIDVLEGANNDVQDRGSANRIDIERIRLEMSDILLRLDEIDR